MRLTATELGLHPEHRRHVLAGQAVADLYQGSLEVLREEGLLGEQLRVEVVAWPRPVATSPRSAAKSDSSKDPSRCRHAATTPPARASAPPRHAPHEFPNRVSSSTSSDVLCRSQGELVLVAGETQQHRPLAVAVGSDSAIAVAVAQKPGSPPMPVAPSSSASSLRRPASWNCAARCMTSISDGVVESFGSLRSWGASSRKLSPVLAIRSPGRARSVRSMSNARPSL